MEQARAMEQMLDADGWKIIDEWLDKRIGYHLKQLETCKTWEDVQNNRSKLDAFRAMKGKPSEIIKNINTDTE